MGMESRPRRGWRLIPLWIKIGVGVSMGRLGRHILSFFLVPLLFRASLQGRGY